MQTLYTLATKVTDKELRELDAWIAEHVMGWKWFSACSQSFLIPPFAYQRFKDFSIHWTEGFESRSLNGETHKCKKSFEIQNIYSDYDYVKLPYYTADRTAAMMVLEKCHQNIVVETMRSTDGLTIVRGQGMIVDADTFPLAICLFAKQLFSQPTTK